ncbi:hypothetical protein HJ01_01905 [Flavobacterium frigoris PS1]|uniref:Uncharacterized protein n=1 Tax=Flavobacterium frigoris (strain PS1) TaxID=1086011 RepID=H7FRP3_FLAFP|nr:hypothetical protein HJ01_01905 [Flavobacterium frigoris PS1]
MFFGYKINYEFKKLWFAFPFGRLWYYFGLNTLGLKKNTTESVSAAVFLL